MLSPAALAIIMTAFQGHQRAKALAAWGAVGGAGAAIGVLLGGVLTEFDCARYTSKQPEDPGQVARRLNAAIEALNAREWRERAK